MGDRKGLTREERKDPEREFLECMRAAARLMLKDPRLILPEWSLTLSKILGLISGATVNHFWMKEEILDIDTALDRWASELDVNDFLDGCVEPSGYLARSPTSNRRATGLGIP
jgi:hypothetical protein